MRDVKYSTEIVHNDARNFSGTSFCVCVLEIKIRRALELQVMLQGVLWKPKYSMQIYAKKSDGQECSSQLPLISDNMVTGIMSYCASA
jgi:hypothetical protein